MVRHAHPCSLLLSLAAVIGCALAAGTASARQKAPTPHDWQGAVQVDDQAAAKHYAANTMCMSVNGTIHKHIDKMRALTSELEKSKSAAAPNLYGAFQRLMGRPYTSAATLKKSRELESERRTTEELNTVLASQGCPKIDIDRELRHEPLATSTPTDPPSTR
jgi:hypothetical protein